MLQNFKAWIKKNPHAFLLIYWIFYLLYFELLELFAQPRYIIYSPIDDLIPFNEYFIIAYMLWFPLLVIPFAYFLFRAKEEFQDLCFFAFTGMTISLLIYTFFPNGLALRVDITHQNICADIVRMIQSIDTPTNVCPSIHVASTVAIWIAVMKHKSFSHSTLIKAVTTIVSILIIISTATLKQHSIIDVIAGLALTLVLYPITYRCNWRKLFSHTILKKAVA